MFIKFLQTKVLMSFFEIDLTNSEKQIAIDSIINKYSVASKRAFYNCILGTFPILFLDTSIIVNVLIPITMVAGTAWFSISLASMKQKFETF